jgi:hypothetical protein
MKLFNLIYNTYHLITVKTKPNLIFKYLVHVIILNYFKKKGSKILPEWNKTLLNRKYQFTMNNITQSIHLIDDIKIRDNFKCVVDNNHISFLSNDKNYVEGHHIIPMYQQKNYNFEVDVIDNIVSLCPNCHKEVHLADDKTTVLKNLYEQQNSFMSRNQVDLADLYKMYN